LSLFWICSICYG